MQNRVQCYPDKFADGLNMHVPYCDVHPSVMNYQKKKKWRLCLVLQFWLRSLQL